MHHALVRSHAVHGSMMIVMLTLAHNRGTPEAVPFRRFLRA